MISAVEAERAAELLAAGCERFGVPGAQLGLLRAGRRDVLCAGLLSAGWAEPIRPSTPFHAGSIAKSLAALLVLDAARRGEVDIDTPCSEQAEGLWTDTPRALMAQTTGRANVLPDLDEELATFVARVAEMPLVHRPGRFSYCNAGWPVLDLLLTRRCGAGFEDLARERVLGPAASFGMPAAGAAGHGVGPDQPVHPVPSEYAAAASAAGSRWWASADELLDYAALHLGAAGQFNAGDIREMQQPQVAIPGATVADAWGLGWALWDRGRHRAFGWAGYTGGHRAYLRCFPEQNAAVVLLANCAGPLFGPPGGSALFDVLLPDALELLGVPALRPAARLGAGRPAEALAGRYGPLSLLAAGPDSLVLHAEALGSSEPLELHRIGGDAFAIAGDPPGGMTIAVDADLLYLGPFAVSRN